MAIFKKENPASCENYRPISLLAIGYKVFATILLRKLKTAGANARVGPHNSVFELAEVVQMLCLLQSVCWNELALQKMVR